MQSSRNGGPPYRDTRRQSENARSFVEACTAMLRPRLTTLLCLLGKGHDLSKVFAGLRSGGGRLVRLRCGKRLMLVEVERRLCERVAHALAKP